MFLVDTGVDSFRTKFSYYLAMQELTEEGNIITEEGTAPSIRIISLLVPKGETPERIDQYLARMIANTSRSKVQEALAAGAVFVNGEVLTRGSYKIKGLNKIELHVPKSKRMKTQAKDITLE